MCELKKQFEKQKEKLNVFTTLTVEYKLMKDNTKDILYAEEPGFLQSWKRWWYGETREKTFDYLDIYMTNFMIFLDAYLRNIRENDSNSLLGKKICAFINSIIPGLYCLKNTYPNYEKIHCKIDSIILTLLDFKKEYNMHIDRTNRNTMVRSKSFEHLLIG